MAEQQVAWPKRTRVLFVVASPHGFPPPPATAHLLALRRAMEPWVGTRSVAQDDDTDAPVAPESGAPMPGNDRLDRCLTVLARAAEAIGEVDEQQRCTALLRDCDPTLAP